MSASTALLFPQVDLDNETDRLSQRTAQTARFVLLQGRKRRSD